MLAVLRKRDYALLWSAGALSGLGDWALLIALPYYVFDLTGSALATGIMFMAYNVPRVLFSSPAGVFVDRWDRRSTMILADLSRAALIPLLLVMRSPDTLWIAYLVTFLQSAIGQLFFPAKTALIPSLVGEKHLTAANSLDSLTMGLTRLIGPFVGGTLMALVGLAGAVLVDSASFLLSAALIAFISSPARTARGLARPGQRPVGAVWASVWQDWREGIRLVSRNRAVAAVFVAVGLEMVGYGALTVLLVAFAHEVLRGGAAVYGYLATAQGIGTLIGSFGVGLAGRFLPPTRLLPLALGATGLAFLAAFNGQLLPLVLVLMALAGVFLAGAMVGERTLLQSSVADEYRGRVFGTQGTSNSLLILVGMALASLLGGFVGVIAALSLASGLYVLAGVVAALMLARADMPRDEEERVAVRE